MQEQVTAVETNGKNTMDFSVDEPGEPVSSARPAAKFAHPGGSRPLEGYALKRGVGHGGFGEIYYAISDAGKEVALKLIRRNLDVELRGIRHCLNLKHPNLLDLYDIRQDEGGDTWVVMEYVSGQCLADAIEARPQGMPVEEAMAWFHGIGAGVAYLHDRGIVHRDLKPANIFSDEGVVKVGDYGLSKFISCSRRSGQTESVGTVHYMAPEVANGRYGKEIDVYALGIVLFEILTGRVPFEGESVGEVLMKHLTAQPDLAVLAEPYRSVVARALEKDPAKRFGSVGEMLAALPQPSEAPPGAARLPSGTYAGAAGAAGAAGVAAAAPPPIPEGVVQAEVVDEEPIFRAVRDTWQKGRVAWERADFAMPVKIAILVVLGLILLYTSWAWLAMVLVLLSVYGVYWVIRALVMANQPSAGTASQGNVRPMPSRQVPSAQVSPEQPATPPRYGPAYARTKPGRRARHRRRHLREQAAAALVVKTPRERLTELLGSLLGGSLAAIVMCLVMGLLLGFGMATPSAELCAWLAMVSLVGSWGVLIPAKFWEGTRGEATLRRFIMMVIGLGFGVLAFGVASLLLVDLPADPDFAFDRDFILPTARGLYAADGQPLVLAYMAVFGTLFLVLRWWRQADPLRASRLSLGAVLVTTVLAWAAAGVWAFPQPWLPMIAAAVSVSVQLASPWVHPGKRFRRHES